MDIDVGELKRLYLSGWTQKRLAEKFECSRSWIYYVMKDAGISARNCSDACPNKYSVDADLEKSILDLYASGKNRDEVAMILRIPAKAARRIIRVNGHTRTRSEAGFLRTEKNKHVLDQNQLDLIYGTLLGDASLSIDGRSIAYTTSHCDMQRGYIDWIRAVIGYGCVGSLIATGGFAPGNRYHYFKYRNKGALKDVWDVVMLNGKKTVNTEWVNKLTLSAIAYWFMDDGSSTWVGPHRNRVKIAFATYSFTKSEIELLCARLQEFGIRSNAAWQPGKKYGKGYGIRISESDSNKFMMLIEPIVRQIPCMSYKIKMARYIPSSERRKISKEAHARSMETRRTNRLRSLGL